MGKSKITQTETAMKQRNTRHTVRLFELAEKLWAYCEKHRLDISHVMRNGVRVMLGEQPVEPVAEPAKKPKRKGEPK